MTTDTPAADALDYNGLLALLAKAMFEDAYKAKLAMWSDETRAHWVNKARAALAAARADPPAAARVAELREALQDAILLLVTARDQFDRYAEQHSAKGTPEADAKAAVNASLADSLTIGIDRAAALAKDS